MIRIVLILLILALVFVGPQLWVKRVFAQYRHNRDDFPGTGSELARHLLDRFNLHHVKVETTPLGDHYDPEFKVVRLTQDNFGEKSLTAATVAAHEVGHALQDQAGYQPLIERTRLVRIAQGAEKNRSFCHVRNSDCGRLDSSACGWFVGLFGRYRHDGDWDTHSLSDIARGMGCQFQPCTPGSGERWVFVP